MPEVRNLPDQIRALGPPDHCEIMNAMGDMMDGTYDLSRPGRYNELLAEALRALVAAAQLPDDHRVNL